MNYRKLSYIIPIAVLAAIGIAIGIFLSLGYISYAGQTDDRASEQNRYKTYEFFSATTTSATSTHDGGLGMDIKGAKKVVFYFSRGDTTGQGNTGSSRFEVEVSPDNGTTWHDYNQLREITVSGGSADFDLRVGTSTISAATSTSLYQMDSMGFSRARCLVIETTDGEHTCIASADF